nr:hypothetical protein [Tanacetum cinerariifolium]
ETLAEGNEGALHLGPERARVYTDLSPKEKDRGQGNNARGTCVASNGGAQNRVGNANPGKARKIKCYNCNGIGHITRNFTQPKRPQNSEYFKDKMLLMKAQENKVALDKEQLLFIAGGQDTVVDEDVDEQPTMFMENLSSLDLVYDKASPSYASGILSEVHDHDNYQDVVCEHHEVHEMHDDVQQNCVVKSDALYTSDSNMISYDQYVKDNVESVVHSNNKVVNASLTVKLARYKEQVELYERRAKFELNEREQMIEEQLRIIITDHNIKEENLKKELHSVKMQLNSTINHNKSMVEEVTSLKTDFQQKNKYLEEFLDMKALKKVEDRLFKQDQSVQTVHMLCKPKSFYDESNWVAIGYMNPFYMSKAKQVQPALYNAHEIVKPNHDHALVHDSEDTLEIAETTRKQMLEKMNDLECVKKNVKIAPHDYSKENYLATFTPQKQLTPEQIFWSNDLIKIHAKALSAKAKSANSNRALTVYHPSIPAKFGPQSPPKKKSSTTLVKEIKEMKEVFEKMEAEMDQHAIDKKYTMADMNIPANDVPTKPAPAIAPPTRTDNQILPLCIWVPVGKINYVLDRLKSQRNPIFKILWGIIRRSNIDYAERIWEEFVQSIQSCFTDKKRLTMSSQGKKKTTPLLIPSIKFTKLIIHHLKTKHNIHPRTGSPLHYSHEDNVLGNLMSVGKDNREVFEEEAVLESPALKATNVTKSKTAMQTKSSAPKVTKPIGDKAPKPTSSQPPKPTPKPTKSSKEVQGKKYKLVKETSDASSVAKQSKASNVAKKRKSKSPLKLVDEFVDEGVPVKEPVYNDEEANFQRAMELSLNEQDERTQGPSRLVVFRGPDSRRFQPLLEKKNPSDQFIFHMRTPMTTGPSRNIESSFLDAKLALADSEIDFDVPDISMAKDTEMEVTFTVTPVTTTDNLKLPVKEQVILEEPTSSTGTLSSLHHLDKDFNFSDQFLNDKSSDVEKEKTHVEAEVELMATVTIQQDTSFVPPMTFKGCNRAESSIAKLELGSNCNTRA